MNRSTASASRASNRLLVGDDVSSVRNDVCILTATGEVLLNHQPFVNDRAGYVALRDTVLDEIFTDGVRDADDGRDAGCEEPGEERESIVDATLVDDARRPSEPGGQHPVVGTRDRVVQVQQRNPLSPHEACIREDGGQKPRQIHGTLEDQDGGAQDREPTPEWRIRPQEAERRGLVDDVNLGTALGETR